MGVQEHHDRLQKQVAASADEGVQAALSTARGLRAFLNSVDKLSNEQLALIVDQAIAMLEGFYVHLPFKRSMHGIEPVRRLRLLRRRLADLPSEIAFHKEMTEIFTSLRDLHTRYVLPSHFAQMVAFLPFRVEAWYEESGAAHYIVSRTAAGFSDPSFVRGVELRYSNGVPIERAVEIAAEYHAGSNPWARRARGLAGLTMRAMSIAPPPDEEWSVIGYTTLDGREEDIRLEWTISNLPPDLQDQPSSVTDPAMASAMGLDLEGDTFRRVDRMLFAPEKIKASRELAGYRERAKVAQVNRPASEAAAAGEEAAAGAVQGTDSIMPLVFTARKVTAHGRQAAYVRIQTFLVDDDSQFVNEFLRLINLPEMPNDGLIIDVRGNGGGLIWAGERLLQLLTPRTIEPCRAQFISTPQSLDLCRAVTLLGQWLPSLERSIGTGAPYSAAFPITPQDKCNDIGQRYYGPVVLITDARSYSTTDIFAAGFRDHDIGWILGTDQNMGAGGANVWTLDQIREFFNGTPFQSPLQALPFGAGMRVAIRRTLRVGAEAGTEMEDLGIAPDKFHRITKNDVLDGDPDLIAYAIEMLAELAATKGKRFDLKTTLNQGQLSIELATTGVDYVDVYIDGRSRGSHDVSDDAANFQVEAGPGSRIDLRGYRGTGELVCARRWSL
jgi:C-terminal processing protease CtpA/Prc